MSATSRRIAFRLAAGVVTVASWLVIGTGHPSDYLGPFVALGALACLAGWRGDRVAALVICLGGIVGATAVAWGAGAVGVTPDADTAMRSAYYAMLVFLAAARAAVIGFVVVVGGYLVGRQVRRSQKPERSDTL